MPRWSVDLIRNRAQHIGTVVAPNEKDAIAAAIKQFEIEPARRNQTPSPRSAAATTTNPARNRYSS